MDAQFWINAWNEGRTGFHQSHFHPKMTKFFPMLRPEPGQKVLVPLCGKTRDMIWLHDQKLVVHGYELYEQAVKSFFEENQLKPELRQDQFYKHYSSGNITVSVGDFFQCNEKESYDLIYDRASLVALPETMRQTYSEVVTKALKPQGKYILIVYEYNQDEMAGPPFSISDEEIRRLYQGNFSISLLESENLSGDNGRLSAVPGIQEKAYLLEKLSK